MKNTVLGLFCRAEGCSVSVLCLCLCLKRVKKDVEKGTIHSDMFLLKREGKEGQGTKNIVVISISPAVRIFFFYNLSSLFLLQRSGRGPG